MKKAKLKVQKPKEEKITNDFSMKKFIITIVVIVLVLIPTYFLADYLVKKKGNNSETQEMVHVRDINTINYDDVQNMVADSYYLLFNNTDDEHNDEYDAYIDVLKYVGHPVEFYYIDLSKEENKKVVSDKSSLDDLTNIKVKETTLILVEDGKITETYEGNEKIVDYLSSFLSVDEGNEDESLKASDDNKEASDNEDVSKTTDNEQKSDKSEE